MNSFHGEQIVEINVNHENTLSTTINQSKAKITGTEFF